MTDNTEPHPVRHDVKTVVAIFEAWYDGKLRLSEAAAKLAGDKVALKTLMGMVRHCEQLKGERDA